MELPATARKLRALIVDDDRISRTMLARTVEKWGYEVSMADDGTQAWEQLRQDPPDILLTDWEMPGLEGPKLCARVRELEHDGYIYIVMVTHHQEAEQVAEGLSAGADDFVHKPYNPIILKARLGVATRIVRLEAELRAARRKLEAANLILAQQAATDVLMGIGNRRSFDEALTAWHERATKTGVPFGILMIDVDRFKAYNDLYGHQAGDTALSSIAEALLGGLRKLDRLFRYGGEEIAVLLWESDRQDALRVAERLRQAVWALQLPHESGCDGRVTVSIGADSSAGEPAATAAQRVRRADDALYLAKAAGRNRVMGAEP
jgi:diguanylate cyclase (GGDEF)-like protein